MTRQIIHTDRAPQAIGTYSQAVRVGDTVYLSGQIPLDPATMQLVTRRHRGARSAACSRTSKAVAEAAGGSLAQAVKVTVFLTDLAHFAKVNEIMAQYCLSSLIRRAPRSASRSCRAARASRSSASCTLAEAGAAARRAARSPSSARSRRCAASGPRSPSACSGSASRRCRTCCSSCRCATRTARRSSPIGALAPGHARGGRGRGAAHRSRLPPPAPAAVHASPTAPAFSRCASSISPARSRAAWRAARACAASARCGADRSGSRWCTRSTGASAHEAAPLEETLTPIYPRHRRRRRRAGCARSSTRRCASWRPQRVRDWIPRAVLEPLGLPSLNEALSYVHRPPREAQLDELAAGRHPAQRRLAFEELLAHQLSLQAAASARVADRPAPAADGSRRDSRSASSTRCRSRSPARSSARSPKSTRDLCADVPMVRLVQGDVGCGKTVVAAAAAARAAGSGLQAALMAPTELLAEQHWRNFRDWFHPLGHDRWRCCPARSRRARAAARSRRSPAGEVRIVVGTHALFQEGIDFAQLALVIVDEQHRFGVQQRLRCARRAASSGRLPHQLIMTATPIPRTLAMTAYADLDISVIDELPPGRTPVQDGRRRPSSAATRSSRASSQACRDGRQAYWVCPLIEESDELRCAGGRRNRRAAAPTRCPSARRARARPHAAARRRTQAMQAFKAGKIQLLVATTVIEVGVDVPNATLMVIENAERMGLAQLHQLRGRVGRGAQASTCVLLYRAPLSQLARERLKVIRETNDGFEIARRDLELRGPGELLGTRQTGLAQLRVADLMRDADLLPGVQAGRGAAARPATRRTSRRSRHAGSAPTSATAASADPWRRPLCCGACCSGPSGSASLSTAGGRRPLCRCSPALRSWSSRISSGILCCWSSWGSC